MRHIPLLLTLLFLSSCYQPVYGDKPFGAAPSLQEQRLNSISLGSIPDEQGQILRNFLIDRMYGAGRPTKTNAHLDVQLSNTVEDLGLQKDATSLRKKITYTALITLSDSATHKNLLSATSRAIASYNIIDQQYGALVSKENATQRAMRELSNLIVTRLLVYFGEEGAGRHIPAPVAP